MKPLTKFIGKHLCWSLLLIKLQVSSLKETPAQTFSCRFLQILKQHTFIYKTNLDDCACRFNTDCIAIKIQIVFMELNWIFKVNSQKSVFPSVNFIFLFLLYLRKESYMNIRALGNFISLPCTSSNSGKASWSL